jgi:hypothetical protein
MKGRTRKDGTNAINMNGEVGGDGGKNRLENENMSEYYLQGPHSGKGDPRCNRP